MFWAKAKEFAIVLILQQIKKLLGTKVPNHLVWQPSGKARDCNSLTDGSIPSQASIKKGKYMVKIIFEYRDTYSNWQWRRQQCIMSSVEECIKVYGLGVDCDYRIISVEPVEKQYEKY